MGRSVHTEGEARERDWGGLMTLWGQECSDEMMVMSRGMGGMANHGGASVCSFPRDWGGHGP
jgi:hypothetical protein